VFKQFSGSVIERIYITGVTPITLDALTSGFNHVVNRSLDYDLKDMIGFTQGEVDRMVEYYGVDPVHIDVMREHYDGYVFTDEEGASGHIYNSTLVFYYLANVVRRGKAPEELADARISSDPDMVRGLLDLHRGRDSRHEILGAALEGRGIASKLLLKFGQDRFMESRADMVSMLYYLGLLTVAGSEDGEPLLRVPNKTVEALYSQLYLGYLSDELVPGFDDLGTAVGAMLLRGDVGPFRGFLHKNLSLLSDHDFDHMNEQGIKNFVVAYLRLYQNITLLTELETESGRIDVAVLPTLLHVYSHYYIMELKYISKSKYSEAEYERQLGEAKEQLARYRGSEKLAEVEKRVLLHKLAIIVVKDEVYIEEL